MQVEITAETETSRGWEFIAQAIDDDGALHRYVITLSWSDYDLWSRGGADRPADVAEAVMRFLLNNVAESNLPESFDASRARRLAGDADERIPKLIEDRYFRG